jgi:hypothetical protein
MTAPGVLTPLSRLVVSSIVLRVAGTSQSPFYTVLRGLGFTEKVFGTEYAFTPVRPRFQDCSSP